MSGKTYTVRRLALKDLFALGRIISKLTDEVKEKLSSGDASDSEIVLTILESAFNHAEDDLYAFFADITGATVDEVKNMDLAAVIDVVEQVVSQEDFPRLLGRLRDLPKKISSGRSST